MLQCGVAPENEVHVHVPDPCPTETDHTANFLHGCFLGPASQTQVYTLIGGVNHPGLLVDPGASKGLIGSDTLKYIFDTVLRPRNLLRFVEWHSSGATFTGISTNTEHSVGRVKFPIGLAGIPWATFGADVIGGASSWCPGLMPLKTLSAMHCILACGWHPNGDGVLGVWHSGTWKPQHLYLTDTGHYMLRVDQFGQRPESITSLGKTVKSLSQALPKKAPSVDFHSGRKSASTDPSSVFQ